MVGGPINPRAIGKVEREMDRLEELDEVTPQDLERFRKALPTDPDTAEFVQRSVLRWPLNEVYEYMSESDRQSAYWRVRPFRRQPRSEREAAYRERFRETMAGDVKGSSGTTFRNGRELPRSAAIVQDELSDIDVDVDEEPEDPPPSGVRAARRLQAFVSAAPDPEPEQ